MKSRAQRAKYLVNRDANNGCINNEGLFLSQKTNLRECVEKAGKI